MKFSRDQFRELCREVRHRIRSLKPLPKGRPRAIAKPKSSQVGPTEAKPARSHRKVSAATYSFVTKAAHDYSLDRASFLYLLATEVCRIRPRPAPDTWGKRIKLIRLTICTPEARRIERAKARCGAALVHPTDFAIGLAGGQYPFNPSLPVLLTTIEEQTVGTAEAVRDLAGRCIPPPDLKADFQRACAALRRRVGAHGLQPGDAQRCKALRDLLCRLEGEIMVAIDDQLVNDLWRQCLEVVQQIGVRKGAA